MSKSVRSKVWLLMTGVVALSLVCGGLGAYFVGERASAESGFTGYDSIYTSENPVPEIAANTRPSVVQVIVSANEWYPSARRSAAAIIGYGSGTYIGDTDGGGYILTNYHVVESGEIFEILWLDETKMECELVGYDDGTDIALLKFSGDAPSDAKPVPMGDSDLLQIGELAIVIGNPGAGDYVLYGTVTAGIISGLERRDVSAGNFTRSVSVIQIDAAINSGNSGGALLNSKGELVGIPTLKIASDYSSVYEGLGFCVPINTVKPLIAEIIESGTVTRPVLGIGVGNFDGPDEPIKSHAPAGVMVSQVAEGSSAEEAGVLTYDVITEVNGARVKKVGELTAELDKLTVGDTVTLKVYRYYDKNGALLDKYQELEFKVELRAQN